MKNVFYDKNFYETEAEEKPLWGSPREIALIDSIFRLLPKERKNSYIADIGCGDGFLSYNLKKRFKNVFSLDLSFKRLNTASSNLKNAALLNGDITDLPFKDKIFDLVICSEVLEHIADLNKALGELSRIAKKTIIITVPYKQEPILVNCPHCKKKLHLSGHVNYFTGKELIQAFHKEGFTKSRFKIFYTIFSYNSQTLKLPGIIRTAIDGALASLSKFFSFLKPGFLVIRVKK